jgi:hypothetical protein
MSNNTQPINVIDLQLATWREQMLNRLLPLTTAIATVGVAVGIATVVERGKEIYIPIYAGAWLLLLLITLFKRIAYRTRAIVLVALIAILGVTILSETGLAGEGRSFLVVLPIAALVLLGWRYSLGTLILASAIFLIFGLLRIPGENLDDTNRLINWILAATLAAMLATGVVISLRALLENLISTLEKEQKARRQLRDVSDHWERKVAERTRELDHRSAQVAIGLEITRAMCSSEGSERLLSQATVSLLEKLDLDHVAVFVMDKDGKSARLRAAAGDAASHWLATGRISHSGDGSLVGWSLEQGRCRMTTHPGELTPPLLPETRSAMSLPLHFNGNIIGALELQSAKRSAFLSKDLVILQDTADQLAAALTAADRVRELESELASARRLSGREGLVSEIAGRMHESRDLDAVLKTAAFEIHRALGLRDISIRLGEIEVPAQHPSPEETLS